MGDAGNVPISSFWQSVHLGSVLTGLLVLALTWFLSRFVGVAFSRLGDRFVDRRLALNQASSLLRFGLLLGGIGLAVAVSVQLSRDVVLTLAGTGAVTVGLALKDLAASVLAGIVILLDRPFQVGDRVSFGGYYGEITSIGLRSVRLVTLDDSVVTIPNNKFLTEATSSGNWGALDMMIQLDFFVGIEQDTALARRLVSECLASSRYVSLAKPWVVQLNQVVQGQYFAVRVRAQAYVLDVKYEKEFNSDVTERVLEAFRAHAVLPPAVLTRSIDGAVSSAARAVAALEA